MNSNSYDMTREGTDPKPLTDEEFTEFQKAEKLKVDGRFGKHTLARAKKVKK